MKPIRNFFLIGLVCSIVVGFSAGNSHNDFLLLIAEVLSLTFFAGACLTWDINQPTNPKGNTHD